MVHVQSERGEGRAPFRLPFDPATWRRADLAEVIAQGRHLLVEKGRPGAHREIGEQLFETLFSGEVLRLYERCLDRIESQSDLGLRIKLMIDPREPQVAPLQDLPWELMRQPGTPEFLALSRRRLFVRYLAVPRPIERPQKPQLLRLLCIASNPANAPSLALDRELGNLQETVGGEGIEIVEIAAPTLEGVRRALLEQECHILHFMGHGDFAAAKGGALWFESPDGRGDPIRGEDLANKLADIPSLRLAVLNACDSGGTDGAGLFTGVASSLVLAGMPAVVAMRAPISDRAALVFSETFYRRLMTGDPVDLAVTEARQAIHSMDPGSFEWATPVVYMRIPDGDLYFSEPTDTRIKPSSVILSPLFACSFQPSLPPDFTSLLRDHRQAEIKRVHTFLGSQEKKLLILEGLPSVDATDLLLVSLQDVPAGARKPILWWDCEKTDSLSSVAEEWARAFRDTNLRTLLQQRQKLQDVPGGQDQDRRDLDREIMAWLLSRLEKSPHTIVLTRFDQWLEPETRQIEDEALSDFVRRVVNHPQKGKMILISEEKPVLPRDLNPAWAEGFLVQGLSIGDALDFLQNHLGVRAAPELIKQAAERLGRHPRALRLLAGSLVGLEPAEQEDRLRQFLQVKQNPLPGSELRPLLESACDRLSPAEMQALDLLTIVRQPLSADELQEIGVGQKELLTAEEVRRTSGRLMRERYWLEAVREAQTGKELFRLVEMARPFLEERIGEDRGWKAELHRRAFAWYQRRFPVDTMDPMVLPPLEEVAGYDELIHQAFSLAEIAEGEEKNRTVLVGGQVLRDSQNWHVFRDSRRVQIFQLSRARRLLEGDSRREAKHLYCSTLEFLGDLYMQTDRLVEAKKWYEEALPLCQAVEDRLGEANTLMSLGDLYVRTDRLAEAETRYEEALPLYRAIEDRLGEANTLRSLGGLYVRTDRLAEAEKRYEEALPLYRAIDSRLGEASTLMSLGILYVRTFRLAEAEKRYEEALPLYRAIDSRLGEASTLMSLGTLYVRTSRLAEAEKRYEEALPLYRAIDSRLGEANTLKSLGDLYVRESRLTEAEKRYEEVLRLFRMIEDRLGEAKALEYLGDLYVRTFRLAEAENRYEEALLLFRAIKDRLGEANTLRSLGNLYVRKSRLAEAEKRYEEALLLFRAIKDRLGEANTLMSLGDLYVQRSRLTEAEKRYEEALPLYRAIDSRLGEANTLRSLGDLYVRKSRFAEAEKQYEEALPLYRKIEFRLGEANTLRSLGDLHVRKSRLAEAEKQYEEALPLFRAVEDRLGEANTLKSLGDLYVRKSRFAEAEKQYEEALPLYRKIEFRLGEANALLGLGWLRATQNWTEEAEGYLQTARSLYVAIDEKVGQINCSLRLSDVYRETNRPADALREALTAFLIGPEVEGLDPGLRLSRLFSLRVKVGQEVLGPIAKQILETFPSDAQGTLNEGLGMVQVTTEEKPDPATEAPAEAGPAPVSTSAPDTPPPV